MLSRSRKFLALTVALFALRAAGVSAQKAGAALRYVETADGVRNYQTRSIVRWTHARLVFAKDLERIAVGHESMIDVEILGPKEALLLGRGVGRTSIIVWYRDSPPETYLFTITPDLSALERALTDIHPAIRLDAAPDRAAVILRGTVPDVGYARAAEAAARSYLAAGISQKSMPQPIVQAGGAAAAAAAAAAGTDGAPVSAPTDPDSVSLDRGAKTDLAVINLIRVTNLPEATEQKIVSAVSSIGGPEVRVTRIQKSDLPDDAVDTLLLEGTVRSQVDLVRVVNVAAQLFLGHLPNGGQTPIEVIADEGGAMVGGRDRDLDSLLGSGQLSGGVGAFAGSTGNGLRALRNSIQANLGRAKLLSVASGRLLSVIRVTDLPQVRVSVQIHEVNVTRLSQWTPNASLMAGDFHPDSFNPAGSALVRPGGPNQRIGEDRTGQVADALQTVRGALTNQFQIGWKNISIDALFTMLEQEGISRRLSNPTLTVLAGELAQFHVGGQVPVPHTFSTAFGSGGAGNQAITPGIHTGVDFLPFGVELSVRPMVDEEDAITLDVRPVIIDPDTQLTQEIVASTNTPAATTAFRTRSLQTTARVKDSQPLVIGGLITRDSKDKKGYTPVLHRLPVVGWFSKAMAKSQDDLELVIVLTPTIVRDRIDRVETWEFPTLFELMESSVAPPPPTVRNGQP